MNRNPNRRPLLTLLAAGALLGSLSAGAFAQTAKQPLAATPGQQVQPQTAQPAQEFKLNKLDKNGKLADQEDLVGKQATDFTLTDTLGEEHTLADYLGEGKIVVLEWFNPTCPYIIKHHQWHTTMTDLAAKYADQDVVWLAINSGKRDTAEQNEKFRQKWSIEYPVLMDSEGAVGKAYGSKNTPTMYVIDKAGVVRYAGAIDNDSDPKSLGDTNYVEEALDAVIAGSNVETAYAKPYGCGVKYKN
ncbi:MAG: redoxin domain-containing protein [Phycisphaerales bacterium]|nr:redoxin domain-containing protein [Phycisphaerales bacterium]